MSEVDEINMLLPEDKDGVIKDGIVENDMVENGRVEVANDADGNDEVGNGYNVSADDDNDEVANDDDDEGNDEVADDDGDTSNEVANDDDDNSNDEVGNDCNVDDDDDDSDEVSEDDNGDVEHGGLDDSDAVDEELVAENYLVQSIAMSEACSKGDFKSVSDLIDAGSSPAVCDSRGWHPIHEAAVQGRIECLQVLLKCNSVDVNATTYDGHTALTLASSQDHYDCVSYLLDEHADPNLSTNDGQSPLHLVILDRTNECQCARLLIPQMSEIDARMHTAETALHLAVERGYDDIVQRLLERGSNPSLKEENGLTPIFVACQFGRSKCLERLISTAIGNGLVNVINEPANDGATPIYIAAQEGQHECVEILLYCGADPNKSIPPDNYVPLMAAIYNGHESCIELLWNVTCDRVMEQGGLLEFAIRSSQKAIVEQVMDLGCDPDIRIPIPELHSDVGPHVFYTYLVPHFDCSSALQYSEVAAASLAVGQNNEEIALTILKRMKHIDRQHIDECPIILLAILYPKMLRIFKLLVKTYRAKINYYYSPFLTGNLSVVLSLSKGKILEILLKCGAEVDSVFDNPESISEVSIGKLFNSPSFTARARLDNVSTGQLWSKASIIRLMLEFTSNVKLDQSLEKVMSTQQWNKLVAITDTPCSLEHLCRRKVRQCLGSQRLRSDFFVEQLELPHNVMSYLLYEDLDYEKIYDAMEDT